MAVVKLLLAAARVAPHDQLHLQVLEREAHFAQVDAVLQNGVSELNVGERVRGVQFVALLPQALEGPLQEFLVELVDDDPNVLFFEGVSGIGVFKELVVEIAYLGVSLAILALEALRGSHHRSFDPLDALGGAGEGLRQILLTVCLACLSVDVEEVDEEGVGDGLEDGAVVEGLLGGDFEPAFLLILRAGLQESVKHVAG